MVTWKMINLGQVSRNQFWGEPDDVVRRPGICNGVVLFDRLILTRRCCAVWMHMPD